MAITITGNDYAGNISENLKVFNFSGEKEKLRLENTGDTVLQLYINGDETVIYPYGKYEYNGYLSTFSLKSRKGQGTYSLTATDSLRVEVASSKADLANLSQFGIVGDGTDETDKFEAALTAIATKKTVLFGQKGKTYKITRPLYTPENCGIENATFHWYGSASLGNRWGEVGMLNAIGSLVGDTDIVSYLRTMETTHVPPTESPVLYTLEKYSNFPTNETGIVGSRITTSDNEYFSVGDTILLMGWTRATFRPYVNTAYEPELRKVAKIIAKDATYLYLDYVAKITYPTGAGRFVNNATLKSRAIKVNTIKGIKIKDVDVYDMTTLTTPATPTSGELLVAASGLNLILAENSKVENYIVHNPKYPAIMNWFGRDNDFDNIQAYDAQMWGGGQGYLLQNIGCDRVNVNKPYANGCRHVVDSSWTSHLNVYSGSGDNGKSSDFAIHACSDHDLYYEDCRGLWTFGHGIQYFPDIVEGVTLNRCEGRIYIDEGSTGDAYVTELKVQQSKITTYRIPLVLQQEWDANSEMICGFTTSATSINKRNQTIDTYCKVKGKITLTCTDTATKTWMGTFKYDTVEFRDLEITSNFDLTTFTNCPSFYVSNSNKVVFDNVKMNQLVLYLRNDVTSEMNVTLNKVEASYVTQTGFKHINIGTYTNCKLILKLLGCTIKNNSTTTSMPITTISDTGRTNAPFTVIMNNNHFIGKNATGTVTYTNTGTAGVTHVHDSGNVIENAAVGHAWNTTNNLIY